MPSGTIPTGNYSDVYWNQPYFEAGKEDLLDFLNSQKGIGAGWNQDQVNLLMNSASLADGRVQNIDTNQDVTELAKQFNQWRDSKKSGDDVYAAYVKAKQAQPGRDQTLLGSDSTNVLGQKPPDFGTVLGAQPGDVNTKKSVLG